MVIRRTEPPTWPTSPGAELSFEVRGRPEEVSLARRAVARFLDGYDVPRSMIDDVQLVASELVTNALQHGGSGPIGIAVRVQPYIDVTLSVENVGPVSAIPPLPNWRPPVGLAPTGRGLSIVRRLSDDVVVRGDDEHAEVVCRRSWACEEPAT